MRVLTQREYEWWLGFVPELGFRRAPQFVYVLAHIREEKWWKLNFGFTYDRRDATVYSYEEVDLMMGTRPNDTRWEPIGLRIPIEE